MLLYKLICWNSTLITHDLPWSTVARISFWFSVHIQYTVCCLILLNPVKPSIYLVIGLKVGTHLWVQLIKDNSGAWMADENGLAGLSYPSLWRKKYVKIMLTFWDLHRLICCWWLKVHYFWLFSATKNNSTTNGRKWKNNQYKSILKNKKTKIITECYEVDTGAKIFLVQTADSHSKYCPIKVQITQSDDRTQHDYWIETLIMNGVPICPLMRVFQCVCIIGLFLWWDSVL